MAWDTENAWRPDWHGRWRSHKPGQALVEQNVARPLLRVRNTGTTERLRRMRRPQDLFEPQFLYPDQSELDQFIQEGMDAHEAGDLVDHEQVEREFEQWQQE